ncbi:MAG: DUF3108 domain-containing protein [Candidatus Omnitrophica bacterium]|nr:DUF3108 domain-containing protein [Candidatus Omnitrophota bacterium]
MNRFWNLIFLICLLTVVVSCGRIHTKKINPASGENPVLSVEKASFKIREGEKLKFSVRWLGMEVGTAEAEVKGIEKIGARDAYHIAVHARSNALIDIIYPVRDEHHSYIDKENFHSLRYEKILREGGYQADEVIDFDQENHKALYHSRKNGTKKQVLIAQHVQDEVSSAYWFRTQPMKVGDAVHIIANVDEKNWDFEVKVLQQDRVEIKELGVFDAFQVEPAAKFQSVFIRRGKIRGWMSTDEKRLPLMMKTKIPVLGTVTVVLVGYEGW